MFYFNDEEENSKKVVVRKKKNKKKKEKQKEQKDLKNELFSFDNEIIIGVTKKEEPKKQIEKERKKINKEKPKKGNKKIHSKNKKLSQSNNKPKNQKKLTKEQQKVIKKKRRIARTIKYGMLLILFIIVILCAMFSPLFNVKTIEIIGNEKITETEIVSLSQIQIEENIFKINKNKIINNIKENAYIDEVIIERKLPSKVIITVEERKSAYLLEYASGYIYIDKQGYMLEINSKKLELPILQGALTETSNFAVGNRLCIEDLERLSILIKVMELSEINGLSNLITRIDIGNKQNIKLIFETKEKVAYLGDNTNLIDKIPLIKKILEENEGKAGEIFVNMDLNKENPIFRERV